MSNQATFMREAARCIDVLHDDAADDQEQGRCAIAARNILTHLQDSGSEFRYKKLKLPLEFKFAACRANRARTPGSCACGGARPTAATAATVRRSAAAAATAARVASAYTTVRH